jgi:hypothetical protein
MKCATGNRHQATKQSNMDQLTSCKKSAQNLKKRIFQRDTGFNLLLQESLIK